MKVTKYLNPQCNSMGKGLHILVKMQLSTRSAHVVVCFQIASRVCLPSRHASHSYRHGSLSVMSMPVTSPSSAMRMTALEWR